MGFKTTGSLAHFLGSLCFTEEEGKKVDTSGDGGTVIAVVCQLWVCGCVCSSGRRIEGLCVRKKAERVTWGRIEKEREKRDRGRGAVTWQPKREGEFRGNPKRETRLGKG